MPPGGKKNILDWALPKPKPEKGEIRFSSQPVYIGAPTSEPLFIFFVLKTEVNRTLLKENWDGYLGGNEAINE
jgi:hypothetical protein